MYASVSTKFNLLSGFGSIFLNNNLLKNIINLIIYKTINIYIVQKLQIHYR